MTKLMKHKMKFNFFDMTDWFIGTDILPNTNFPIIFHSVKGNCESTGGDTSIFNVNEQYTVKINLNYINRVLDGKWNGREIGTKHIGIVTPYRKQAAMIGNMCIAAQFNEIAVGTAETFQGQERNVMIVSTVQCGGKPSFVANVKMHYNLAQCSLDVM